VECTDLAKCTDRWWALVNTTLKIGGWEEGNFIDSVSKKGCVVLCCVVWCCVVLLCVVLCGFVLCCVVWLCLVLCGVVW